MYRHACIVDMCACVRVHVVCMLCACVRVCVFACLRAWEHGTLTKQELVNVAGFLEIYVQRSRCFVGIGRDEGWALLGQQRVWFANGL